MASTQQSNSKKMEYKSVKFDVNEIPPDAPAGEWMVSIPRGKCKVQPTKEDHFPMIIVPVRLDSTEEDDDVHQRALGTELSTFLVFGGKTPRGERMSKLRIRQLCEAADIELDVLPTELTDPENDLQPFIKELEGKKFKAWTKVTARKDTGEETTDLLFYDPKSTLKASSSDDDDDDGDDDDDKPARGKSKDKGKGKDGKGKNKR